MEFILVATYTNGNKGVYTGRPGQEFVNADYAEAFTFQTIEGAQRKAGNLNLSTQLHSWWFVAMGREADGTLIPASEVIA